MNEDDFDPTELENMSILFDKIIHDETQGYEMTIFVSRHDAMDLVEQYNLAKEGNLWALDSCWKEYAKMMDELEQQIESEEDDNY
jgi:preprotein translocase subunit SecA